MTALTWRRASDNKPVRASNVEPDLSSAPPGGVATKGFEKGTQAPVVASWEKMSKSKHNGINPETAVADYGADTVRIYLLFKAPMEMDLEWDARSIQGPQRWLNRIWALTLNFLNYHERTAREQPPPPALTPKEDSTLRNLDVALRDTLRQVTTQLSDMSFNTAIAALMKLSNMIRDVSGLSSQLESAVPTERRATLEDPRAALALETLVRMMLPLAPHMASELYDLWLAHSKQFGAPCGLPTLAPLSEAVWPDLSPVSSSSGAAGDTDLTEQRVLVYRFGKPVGELTVPGALANDPSALRNHIETAFKEKLRGVGPTNKTVLVKKDIGLIFNFLKQ